LINGRDELNPVGVLAAPDGSVYASHEVDWLVQYCNGAISAVKLANSNGHLLSGLDIHPVSGLVHVVEPYLGNVYTVNFTDPTHPVKVAATLPHDGTSTGLTDIAFHAT
jgi:hypothetical protein